VHDETPASSQDADSEHVEVFSVLYPGYADSVAG
jgi:hypothetical protein